MISVTYTRYIQYEHKNEDGRCGFSLIWYYPCTNTEKIFRIFHCTSSITKKKAEELLVNIQITNTYRMKNFAEKLFHTNIFLAMALEHKAMMIFNIYANKADNFNPHVIRTRMEQALASIDFIDIPKESSIAFKCSDGYLILQRRIELSFI